MKTIYVGCCGYPVSRSKYYSSFKIVELQNTFYDLPSLDWAHKTREEAPDDFTFTLKAWQVITHPHTSPTWKKMKKKPIGDLENYGFLKPTRENIDAFLKTLEIAKALGSRVIVLQTPSSMPSSDDMIKQVDSFFDAVKSYIDKELVIGWEMRGEILGNREIPRLLEKHDVVHVVDIFRTRPLYKGTRGVLYIRLHGIGPGEVNYRYDYTMDDLEKLGNLIRDEEYSVGYILFNNVKMYDNALSFKQLLMRDSSIRVY